MENKSSGNGPSEELGAGSNDQPIRLPANTEQSVERLRPSQVNQQNVDLLVQDNVGGADLDVDQEKEWGVGNGRSLGSGWLVLAVCIIFGVALWAGLNVFKAQDDIKESIAETGELARESIDEAEEIRAMQERMKSVVSGYLGAATIDEKLKYSRQSERVKPLMERYYQNQTLESEEFLSFGKLSGFSQGNRSFLLAKVITANGKKTLTLEELPGGNFLVDWEANVHFQPVVWEDFIVKRMTDAVAMRVLVSKDNFYAHEFRDEAKYQCYRVTDRAQNQHVFGYVERGSKVSRELERIFRVYSAPRLALILKIRFPKKGDSNRSVIIDQCLSDRWVYASPRNSN